MASNIDPTIPADRVRAEKAAFRSNFQASKDEIEELQERTEVPWLIALGVLNL